MVGGGILDVHGVLFKIHQLDILTFQSWCSLCDWNAITFTSNDIALSIAVLNNYEKIQTANSKMNSYFYLLFRSLIPYGTNVKLITYLTTMYENKFCC